MAMMMEKNLFNDLKQSLKEAKAIAHGKVKSSSSFSLNAEITNHRFETVWDAIEDTPEEAANMTLRSTLMMAIKSHINKKGLNQAEAAQLLGVTQPRISDLMRGKIHLFGLDALVNMAAAAGLHIEMRISEAA